MRALAYEHFGGELAIREMPDPRPDPDGVVVAVGASGLCRSDWHAWRGHDPDVALPHVPGHELAGTVVAVGAEVRRWGVGDRVTSSFVGACGRCGPCRDGEQQVCERQRQPGFHTWGSLAERVALAAADTNLVAVPEQLDDAAAASLGCRFATAYRAVVHVARVRPGEWVAVHGCGGVGLSAMQVAVAAGARVVAVDVAPAALELARRCGAEAVVAGGDETDAVAAVLELTGGGASASLDVAGSPATCVASIRCLRPRGRHVQVGLLPPGLGRPQVPMDLVIGRELAVLGSHGMAAHHYPPMLSLVAAGRLRPQDLVTRRIGLDDAGAALASMGDTPGITVVTLGTG